MIILPTGAHIKLLLCLGEALPVQGIHQENNAIYGGEIVLPQLARRLVPSEIERFESNLNHLKM